jgi:ADP-ribose pyrophosphatase
METFSIIVGDGLSRDILSPDHPHRSSRANVGRREIERLMGKGKAYGDGPLPTFLRLAHESRDAGAPVPLVLLHDSTPAGDGTKPGSDSKTPGFVEPLEDVARDALLVSAGSEAIPAAALTSAFEKACPPDTDFRQASFLVVGCHTDRRILGVASFLKNVLRCERVAVSSHLVGSATQEAHFAALRHTLPSAGIEVLLDLEEAAVYCGLDGAGLRAFDRKPCRIEPAEARETLSEAQARIVELLCMHWTSAQLRPLAGGFSGSALFLASGWKGSARTEPLVVKIDDFTQMRRELEGYYQVKDFFGKHVPTFGYPVTEADSIGVGMDLAAMEGHPRTLQDNFEEAEAEENLTRFLRRLEKALLLLSEKLYANTKDTAWVVPYRTFGLHAEQELKWFLENAGFILSYLDDVTSDRPRVNPEQIQKLLRLVASNEDGIESEICLAHGDLNFANVIGDDGDNIWFIDWTHSGQAPIELDFAKLENDAKFVMSKEVDVDDLDRLRRLEEYLLSHRIPADTSRLPEDLRFVKWDLRFRRILETVRTIRETCFALKATEDWLVYRVALLKYALHTLSFDKRRDRGECDLPQLMHALYSVEGLVFDLVADDFHLKIRAERPASYPPRQRISIDEVPWVLDCLEYDPPYHVDESVLANDRTKKPDGWADPEDIDLVKGEPRIQSTKYSDEDGRPRNPHGRTGIEGRGLLGYWGCNLSVAAMVLRAVSKTAATEILLGAKEDERDMVLPKGFVLHDEAPEDAMGRVLKGETGWDPPIDPEVVFDGYTYDRRQTDHAWVESRGFLFHGQADAMPGTFDPGGEFDEVGWWPLDADTVNRLPSDQARLIRESVTRLIESERLDRSVGEELLERTG